MAQGNAAFQALDDATASARYISACHVSGDTSVRVTTFSNRAEVALRQKRLGAARFLAKRALELDPSHEKSTSRLTRCEIFCCFSKFCRIFHWAFVGSLWDRLVRFWNFIGFRLRTEAVIVGSHRAKEGGAEWVLDQRPRRSVDRLFRVRTSPFCSFATCFTCVFAILPPLFALQMEGKGLAIRCA